MAQPGIILVSCPSVDDAERLARSLVEEKLIACASFSKVQSIYRWEGQVCSDGEVQIVMKTDLDKFEVLEARIKDLHAYEVPEILAIAVTKGSADYLQWIQDSVAD